MKSISYWMDKSGEKGGIKCSGKVLSLDKPI